jgi:hypothetical protein
MLGRGSRAHGCYYGSLFIEGNEGFWANTKTLLLQPTEINFKEGHSIINIVKAIMVAKKTSKFNKQLILKIVMELLEKDWKINISDLFEHFNAKEKKTCWNNLQSQVLDNMKD